MDSRKWGCFGIYPEAPENYENLIQSNTIFKNRKNLESQIEDIKNQIKELQKECDHPYQYLYFENYGHTDEFGMDWINNGYSIKCNVCGKQAFIKEGRYNEYHPELEEIKEAINK